MKRNDDTISVKTARLIIKHLHNSLTRREATTLDNWISQSDDNEELFARLTKNVDDTVFDADQLIIDTETVIDLWIVSALIIRRQRGLNNKMEEKYLDDWINADKQNKKLYNQLQQPSYMQKMIVWNRLKRERMKYFDSL